MLQQVTAQRNLLPRSDVVRQVWGSSARVQQPRSRVFESCSDSPEPLDHFQVAGIGLGSPHGCHIFAKIVHYRWSRPPSGLIRTSGNP